MVMNNVFLGVFLRSQNGDHPSEELAKFGYKPIYIIIFLYFWLHNCTMFRNLAFFFSNIGRIMDIENLKKHIF
jgi:hypothetical protein